MKKSLIALAVLAASGAAMAQSSVTLFGVLDTSVARVSGNGENNVGLLNNGIATSRLGFRGVEDLGNGLKAQFWIEGAIQPDSGNGNGTGAFDFKRRSSLSLLGNFGEVRVGRFLTAGHDKVSSYSVFTTIGVAGFQGWGDEEVRYNNTVAYYSPNFAGFTFGANYAFDEKAGANSDKNGRYVGFDVTYANGPLSVTVAADEAQDAVKTSNLGNAEALRSYALGTSYNFGAFKLSGLVRQAQAKNEGQANKEFTSYALGATAAVGSAGLVKAQFAHYSADADKKAKQFSLGYEHNLSKRTAVYGTYSYLKNNENGTWDVTAPVEFGSFGAADKSSQGVQVGVRHAF